MKRYLFFGFYAISFALSTSTEGQSISNVQSFQEDGKAVIVYDLLSTDPSKEFYVKLFCSTDGGSAYRPILTQVTGDVNNIVKTGNGKMAIWDVQKEANSTKDEFIFRLDALSVGPNGVLPSYMERGVVVQIMDVMRSGKDVSLLVVVTNRNSSLNQFVFANFLVVDDRDKICRELDGDIGKVTIVPNNEKRILTFIVKNVSPEVKLFSQFEFISSNITVKFKNVPIISGNN